MHIFHTLRSYPKPTALAIGNFDGVHRGHQAIIAEAKSKGLTPALLTFYPHPSKLFRPDNHALRINTLADNFRLLAKAGIEVVFLQHFHAPFSKTEAEHFIRDDLITRYHAQHIIVGEDFVFGHQRKGNTSMLQAAGLTVSSLKLLTVEGAACSSTRIRKAIAEGDISTANTLLGRPFSITSRVQKGQQKGRQIGFPTLNLKIRETPWLEVHLIQPQIIPQYGNKITVEFHRFIRPEQTFANIEALQKQIAQDIEAL